MKNKLRHWLAEKILGRKIHDLEAARHEWVKEQLKHGNTVSLEFVATPIEGITLQ